jgi:prepilin-type N-terminal cleavage/methylation domain-containing protein
MMRKQHHTSPGFSLIEMLVVIIVVGILASVAMQSMTSTVQDARRIRTEREMEMLAKAIVGDPGLTENHQRSDFGYVGDIGAFPPNLLALYKNPGGYATWKGPYIPVSLTQDSTGFKTDEWGFAYSYSGGLTITSTGSGSTISKRIADAADDYLLNFVSGVILDAQGNPPGPTYADSIDIVVTFPDGGGSTTSETYHPNMAGVFRLDSIPVGRHPLRIIYAPEVDTIFRYLTVLPRHKSGVSYQFAMARFGGGGGGTSATYTLRPVGVGSVTDLSRSGCPSNYQCVDEGAADDDATYVYRASNQYRTDVYSLEDPPANPGTVNGVVVFCRARRERSQGQIMPTVFVNSTEYNSPAQDLTTSWDDYSYEWTTSPATGLAWTWSEIVDLQAGVRLRGQNWNFPAYCTQVWIEVNYTN